MKKVFKQEQLDLLIGCLLGDANLQTSNGQTWRVRFIHKAIHQPYIQHKYDILKEFCNQTPTYSEYLDERTVKIYSRYCFNTLTNDSFRHLGNLFYKNDDGIWIKKVPDNIAKYLTPKALAYWYMDDGALKWKGVSNAVRLCTDSFSEHEVLLLKNTLEGKFNLKCSLQKKESNLRIGISESSYSLLKDLILPHLLPCMYYKFPDGNKGVYNGEDISNDIRNSFKSK
jgi:hypothetical protein